MVARTEVSFPLDWLLEMARRCGKISGLEQSVGNIKADIARREIQNARLEKQSREEIARVMKEIAREIARVENKFKEEIARVENKSKEDIARLEKKIAEKEQKN